MVCRIFVKFFTANSLICLVSWTPVQWKSHVAWECKRISTFIFHISEPTMVKFDVEDLDTMSLSNFEFCKHWRSESYILWRVNEILPMFSIFFIRKIQYHYFNKIIQWLLFRGVLLGENRNWTNKLEGLELHNYCTIIGVIRYQQSAPNPVEHLGLCENCAGMVAFKWNYILNAYPETEWYLKCKERRRKICVLRHGVRHWNCRLSEEGNVSSLREKSLS
jgi:hypothetical protein